MTENRSVPSPPLQARDMQGDWFIREVKRCREIGMPLCCCDEWPECAHVLAWTDGSCFACRMGLPQPCRCQNREGK